MSVRTFALRGVGVALPTPYRFGSVDFDAFEGLCHRAIERGVATLVPCGTTGEAALLTLAEQRRLIATAVAAARGRVPVIAGAGSNNTATAVELASAAEDAGAAALLCVTPAYLKPTQTGVIAHFTAIHEAVRIPLILYDVPSRTACPLSDLSVRRLANLPRVIGLKDATAEVPRVGRLRRRLGREFLLLSGDDATQSPYRAAGGDGCISVTANVVPALVAALHRAHDRRQPDEIERLDRILRPLHAALFLEPNPIPLKRALHRLKLMQDGLRLPLTPMTPQAERHLAAVLERITPAEQIEAARFAAAHPLIAPRAA
ncbi:MAG: 4-hydroxy-tetrahydrodipicolinate synthase [Reyranella sp.]|uniref:4-hydroxy-tetrahydrodipicolinate synthase n=1 Tax=Reyranella sp. TaxID=1929291 RepID=UPI001AC2CF73|nr:4-hydroxy-tetrahydrodipicolinate synthase [Reyranella sp.]MBN9091164.1 4-hydroxy-tetrahydrodipicolinate synthase [Reyranella sp.]